MKSKIYIYIVVLIVVAVYARFEGNTHALNILGNIPNFLSAIASAGAFLIAAKTYVANSKRELSKDTFEVYKESLDELIQILRSEEKNHYKLYYIGVTFDALAKLNKVVTETDHRLLLSAKFVFVKREIVRLLQSYQINDYFCHEVECKERYSLGIASAANAFYIYWQNNIMGKSDFYKNKNHGIDFFASYPFSINDELLIKALTMCSLNLDLDAVKTRILEVLKCVETQEKHELIELSEILPVTIAFLLLKNQTKPYVNGETIKLKLEQTYNEKYWIKYCVDKKSWLSYELPSKIAYIKVQAPVE